MHSLDDICPTGGLAQKMVLKACTKLTYVGYTDQIHRLTAGLVTVFVTNLGMIIPTDRNATGQQALMYQSTATAILLDIGNRMTHTNNSLEVQHQVAPTNQTIHHHYQQDHRHHKPNQISLKYLSINQH